MKDLYELSSVDSIASGVKDSGIDTILKKLCNGIHFGSRHGLEPAVPLREEPSSNSVHMHLALVMLASQTIE